MSTSPTPSEPIVLDASPGGRCLVCGQVVRDAERHTQEWPNHAVLVGIEVRPPERAVEATDG